MPLQKILFKPGVNRENTRYTTEGGWYECDKIRFRQGNPEVIGGWDLFSPQTYLGVCRSLWAWVTLGSIPLVGVGTNEKFYIEQGTYYYDITPFTSTDSLTNPFAATNGSAVITVTQASHGYSTGDYVIFYGASSLGGNITAAVLNTEHVITVTGTNTYTFVASATANSSDTGNGGNCTVAHELSPGAAYAIPLNGWGAGTWSSGTWGNSTPSTESIRLWSQQNFGEDLIFGYRGGAIYYWNATFNVTGLTTFTVTIASPGVVSTSVSLTDGEAVVLSTTGALPTGLIPGETYYVVNSSGTSFELAASAGGASINTSGSQSGVHSFSPRAVPLTALAGANEVPLSQNFLLISDASRFTFAFGTNDIYTATFDPMLVRWSDQENPTQWEPAITNQAGSVRLSHGSEIVTAIQTRQEIVVITDTSLYSLQYLGPPYVWGNQILGDNISIVGQNAAVLASGVVYWMGVDKFYMYDGRVQTLSCDLRRFIFSDIDQNQYAQIFAGTNEGFNEVWWFYCSNGSYVIDKYVIYNYVEKIWYYGTMGRTAWLDSGILNYPVAATYNYNLVSHELGVNDNATGTPAAINAYISSSEFDIGDGHNFGFVWRVLPDLTFENSDNSPEGEPAKVTMELYGLTNSGSGVTSDASQPVAKSSSYYITEEFSGQVYTRLRGRQMIFKISSDQINTTWQLGAPRIDIRPDGRR